MEYVFIALRKAFEYIYEESQEEDFPKKMNVFHRHKGHEWDPWDLSAQISIIDKKDNISSCLVEVRCEDNSIFNKQRAEELVDVLLTYAKEKGYTIEPTIKEYKNKEEYTVSFFCEEVTFDFLGEILSKTIRFSYHDMPEGPVYAEIVNDPVVLAIFYANDNDDVTLPNNGDD